MSQIKLPILKKILVLVNIGVIICYLLTCLLPFVNTEILWFIAILGLGFPLIFFALVGFIILWIIFRSRWWLVSLIVLLIGYKQVFSVFAFNSPTKFAMNKAPETIRVLHWNVSSWDNLENGNQNSYRDKMLELVKDQQADVLCIQEFFEFKNKKEEKSNILALEKMGYKNYYFIPYDANSYRYFMGTAIFSKYPMSNSVDFAFSDDEVGEHLLQTDINVAGKTFRLMTTHLQSVRFEGSDYDNFNLIKTGKNPKLHGSRTLISKLKRGYEFRYEQAVLVSSKIAESPYPVIITGDFNDVPNSSTYFKIKGNLQDAFLEKGTFIGRTFRFLSPTLRIDYILADKIFKVTQFKRLTVPYSDHYGLVTDLAF
ncbi:MAG: endonuclease/exonuclease/phosphatase family protein [Ginsengibacter sp.]